MDRQIWSLLVIAAGVGSAVLIAIFVTGDAQRDEQLWLEIGKGLVQLLAVVLFGAAVKLLVDRYEERRLRAEQDREAQRLRSEQHRAFRREQYDRLVQATNRLRRVPVLIEADRSVTTWSEQMVVVLDSGLTLRTIKHQISSSSALGGFPFPNHAELVLLFELMYRYTDWVAGDFARNREILYERQLRTERRGLASWRARRQGPVWNGIKETDAVKDLRRAVSADEREACRDAIRNDMAAVLRAGGSQPGDSQDMWWTGHQSWLSYQEAHGLALEEIARAAIGGSHASGR
jgi:hypothetical protein